MIKCLNCSKEGKLFCSKTCYIMYGQTIFDTDPFWGVVSRDRIKEKDDVACGITETKKSGRLACNLNDKTSTR